MEIFRVIKIRSYLDLNLFMGFFIVMGCCIVKAVIFYYNQAYVLSL